MTLEQAIRGHWAGHAPLTSLVPLAQFWTGAAPPAAPRPLVVLAKPLVETKLRTSGGRAIDDATLRLTIVADSLDAAHEVAGEIERHYDGEYFPLDDGAVLDVHRTRRVEQMNDDGSWHVALDLRALIERTTTGE